MVQLSFLIDPIGGASPPVPPPPLRLVSRVDGVRITGVWDEDLATARRDLAVWLGELAPETRVVDLFLGREESAADAAQRLARPPRSATCLSARHVELDGTVWVRLFGLYQIGCPDLILGVEPDVPLLIAYDLLSRLGDTLLERGAPLPEERSVPFGYWLLGTGSAALADDAFWDLVRDGLQTGHLAQAFDDRMVTPAPRFILEAADISDPESERWLIGGSRAVRTFAAQARALARLGVSDGGDAPSAHDAAVVCSRLEGADHLFAYREAPRSDLDSGWRFGCLDPSHPHDETTTRFAPLRDLGRRLPELVQYLALPAGWVVTREDGGWWISAPGDERSVADVDAEPGAPWEASAAGRP